MAKDFVTLGMFIIDEFAFTDEQGHPMDVSVNPQARATLKQVGDYCHNVLHRSVVEVSLELLRGHQVLYIIIRNLCSYRSSNLATCPEGGNAS